MAESAGKRMRAALESPEVLLMPGGFSPLMARMCEELGYGGFFMAGSQTNAYAFGMPDVGLSGMAEMVENARRITAVSDIPVLMDGDTGWGNVLNVYRTVRACAAAGVAAVSLEDQEAPKKSGTESGRRCVSLEEHEGKVKAAVAARDEMGSDMLICARTDAIGAEGLTYHDALERAVAYAEAGADLVWLNTVQTREQAAEACRTIPAPVLPLWGGPPPSPSIAEWADIGAAALLFPALTTAPGLQSTWELLNEFRERGLDAFREWQSRTAQSPWGAFDYHTLVRPSPERVRDLESAYLPKESQRDYGSTFGHSTQV